MSDYGADSGKEMPGVLQTEPAKPLLQRVCEALEIEGQPRDDFQWGGVSAPFNSATHEWRDALLWRCLWAYLKKVADAPATFRAWVRPDDHDTYWMGVTHQGPWCTRDDIAGTFLQAIAPDIGISLREEA